MAAQYLAQSHVHPYLIPSAIGDEGGAEKDVPNEAGHVGRDCLGGGLPALRLFSQGGRQLARPHEALIGQVDLPSGSKIGMTLARSRDFNPPWPFNYNGSRDGFSHWHLTEPMAYPPNRHTHTHTHNLFIHAHYGHLSVLASLIMT
eukprot:scaffold52858_cov37-Prasinocladus_malaysianus.AAC.1